MSRSYLILLPVLFKNYRWFWVSERTRPLVAFQRQKIVISITHDVGMITYLFFLPRIVFFQMFDRICQSQMLEAIIHNHRRIDAGIAVGSMKILRTFKNTEMSGQLKILKMKHSESKGLITWEK
jgi:hypothetical protein